MKLEHQILMQSAAIGGELKKMLIALLVVAAIMLLALVAQEIETAWVCGRGLRRMAVWVLIAIAGVIALLAAAAALLLLA